MLRRALVCVVTAGAGLVAEAPVAVLIAAVEAVLIVLIAAPVCFRPPVIGPRVLPQILRARRDAFAIALVELVAIRGPPRSRGLRIPLAAVDLGVAPPTVVVVVAVVVAR